MSAEPFAGNLRIDWIFGRLVYGIFLARSWLLVAGNCVRMNEANWGANSGELDITLVSQR
jgi:hypothetical protein